jgi:hypothetical protein
MPQLPITNVVEISVSTPQTGLGAYNVNNLALFTTDAPGSTFSAGGYSIYLDPSQIATDFGTDSLTYAMANSIFSQQPNMLAGGGYLTVIPYIPVTQVINFSGTPTAGSFTLAMSEKSATVTVSYSDTAATIQANIQAGSFSTLYQIAVDGGPVSAGDSLTFTFYGFYDPQGGWSVQSNNMSGSSGSITVTAASTSSMETLGAAITRTQGLVQYFGIIDTAIVADELGQSGHIHGSADVLATAAVVQPLNKMCFFVSPLTDLSDVEGVFTSVEEADYTQTRCLAYLQGYSSAVSDDWANAGLDMMAAYASRALSTNFNGTNTTQTMHLKQLIGIDPDLALTQTDLNNCITAGVDTYPSLQGVPAVFTSGANEYFDQVYNLLWFVGALQVAGFNYLAQADTKIPQTEAGMTGLKGAYRQVCEQAVTNDYLAPGTWTSSTTFGNQANFYANILNTGYYIYSIPVAQQSAINRANRQAPLVQIAIKQAGAIQSTTVIVYINA